jgi:class 3 adenylate cyclase/tetratricopeptide (TPR) repeat protein
VNCPRCGGVAPALARFCPECGTAFSRGCGSCGAELTAGAKFCADCGTATGAAPAANRAAADRSPRDYTPKHLADRILQSKSALEGERKQVTVLFADVKGSMELAGQLDPEQWHAILERFFEILTEGVHRFEGTVNQYTGDGIMALFGAPIAHEDHAHRACFAALHLGETLKTYADALRVEHGLNFSVRMGINSGEVVVGKIGDDLRMDYTAQGHTVGLAQRMEALAESGRALLAASTIDIVHGYFALRDLGATKIKGLDAPVRVAELEGVGRMRTRLDRSRARGLSKFVGRDDEMGRLETALRRSLEGDGQVVGVMAEAGSGKSRLCFEFLESCRTRGITVRTATGVPHGRAVPLQPILDFYREVFGGAPEDTDAQTRQKIAGTIAQMAPEELASLPLLFEFMRVPDPARPAPDLAPDERMRAVIALLRRVTAARSRREPAVLVFEDLHWIDPDTETIVGGIVDGAAGTRTLVLLNFRPEYRAPWIGRTHYQQIALRPLDAAAAALLLADWLGTDASLARFVELVGASTGGNPFFMEEMVQAQIESGGLVGARGHFRLAKPIESITVPASVQSLLAARIDRIDEASKRLLQTAAVIGDEIPEALLERVAGLDRDALRGALRGLVQGEFLYEASLYPESEYAFKHPLTREVAYASLLKERRRALHADVAQALETLAGDTAEQRAALLAHHWEQAGRNLEAARWQTRAATRLGQKAGEAAFHWRKVTELLAGETDAPEARAMLGHARIRLAYAQSRSAGSHPDAAAQVARAVQELGDTDSAERAWGLAAYATVRNGGGEAEEARRLGAEALAIARRVGEPATLAAVLLCNTIIYPAREHPEENLAYVAEIDRVCAEDTSLGEALLGFRPWLIAFVLSSPALLRAGRSGEQAAHFAAARRRLAGSQNPSESVLMHFVAGSMRARQGDAEAALEHGRQALELASGLQNLVMQTAALNTRGFGLLAAGRFDEAADHIERAIETGRTVSRAQAAMTSLPLLAEIHLQRGDTRAALAAAESGVELSRQLGYRHSEATNALWLARARIAAGDLADAEAGIADAADRAKALDARDLLPDIEEARAELARSRGDTAGCERALRAAARLHRENGDEWLATQVEARIGA